MFIQRLPVLPSLRRFGFAIALALGLATLSACTTAPPAVPGETAFIDRHGIGFRSRGPDPGRPGSALIQVGQSTRLNYWQTALAPDGFSRMDELFPASRSAAGSAVAPFKRAPQEPALRYSPQGGGSFGIDDYMNRNPATGLLIARGDEILIERYQYDRSDRQRMTSFSMAKTVIALLIGIALEDGKINAIDDRADRYVPELKGSEYGATPIRHLLTMSSGVRFREEYDRNDDVGRLSRSTWQQQGPGGAAAARLFNERIAAPGSRWYYASAETFVLALVLSSATGESIADYFARKVWRPLGAEADATWLIDATGQEVGYMGLNARVRDFARLALMMARGGVTSGERIVSERWIHQMTQAYFNGQQTGRWFGYGYQTWVFPSGDGDWAMLGVRGQAIFVDPRRELVLVHTAARALSRDPGGADLVALWTALKAARADRSANGGLPPQPRSGH